MSGLSRLPPFVYARSNNSDETVGCACLSELGCSLKYKIHELVRQPQSNMYKATDYIHVFYLCYLKLIHFFLSAIILSFVSVAVIDVVVLYVRLLMLVH